MQFQIVLICKCWRLFEMLLWSMQSRSRVESIFQKLWTLDNNSGKVKNNNIFFYLAMLQSTPHHIDKHLKCFFYSKKDSTAGYTRHPVNCELRFHVVVLICKCLHLFSNVAVFHAIEKQKFWEGVILSHNAQLLGKLIKPLKCFYFKMTETLGTRYPFVVSCNVTLCFCVNAGFFFSKVAVVRAVKNLR